MSIINPATEGQTYCSGSSSATWFVNDQQLITFDQSQLINGTYFTKQNVTGKPYKIIWDGGGNGKEHLIQNSNNYSYQIIEFGIQCKLYVDHNGIRRYLSGVDFNGNYNFGTTNFGAGLLLNLENNSFPKQGANYLRFSGVRVNCPNPGPLYLKPSPIQGFDSQGWLTLTSTVIYNFIDLNYITTRFNCTPNFSTFSSNIQIQRINPNYKIRISDNNQIYEYSIIDRNSVEIIYAQGGIKYIFIAGSQSLNQQYQSEQLISLKCGKDCPPQTCLKCRNNDYVCCYDNNGQVIEIIDDPNFEIDGVC